MLPLSSLAEIVASIRTAGGYADGEPFAEFTVEANPEDIVEKGAQYARGLRLLGADRISLGIQSFDDGMLRWMNRRHTAARAKQAVRLLREAGFGNISIDLIFGISRLSDEDWDSTLSQALALAPEHISAYQLSIEDGSTLASQIEAGQYAEATDEQCRRQYARLCRRLAEAGYRHYEISNFALPGFEARHNSAYWRRVPYVGLGPGAHSFGVRPAAGDSKDRIGMAAHRGNAAGMAAVEEVRRWNSEKTAGWTASEEVLTAEDARVETLMLGLRTDLGLPADQFFALTDPASAARMLAEGALMTEDGRRSGRRIRIPEDRFFVSDEIIRELI